MLWRGQSTTAAPSAPAMPFLSERSSTSRRRPTRPTPSNGRYQRPIRRTTSLRPAYGPCLLASRCSATTTSSARFLEALNSLESSRPSPVHHWQLQERPARPTPRIVPASPRSILASRDRRGRMENGVRALTGPITMRRRLGLLFPPAALSFQVSAARPRHLRVLSSTQFLPEFQLERLHRCRCSIHRRCLLSPLATRRVPRRTTCSGLATTSWISDWFAASRCTLRKRPSWTSGRNGTTSPTTPCSVLPAQLLATRASDRSPKVRSLTARRHSSRHASISKLAVVFVEEAAGETAASSFS